MKCDDPASSGGAPVSIKITHLLAFLHEMVDEAAISLYWCIITWLACMIDYAEFIFKSSANPMDLPELKGRKGRTRKRYH